MSGQTEDRAHAALDCRVNPAIHGYGKGRKKRIADKHRDHRPSDEKANFLKRELRLRFAFFVSHVYPLHPICAFIITGAGLPTVNLAFARDQPPPKPSSGLRLTEESV